MKPSSETFHDVLGGVVLDPNVVPAILGARGIVVACILGRCEP
jgi:hypothetical protein